MKINTLAIAVILLGSCVHADDDALSTTSHGGSYESGSGSDSTSETIQESEAEEGECGDGFGESTESGELDTLICGEPQDTYCSSCLMFSNCCDEDLLACASDPDCMCLIECLAELGGDGPLCGSLCDAEEHVSSSYVECAVYACSVSCGGDPGGGDGDGDPGTGGDPTGGDGDGDPGTGA